MSVTVIGAPAGLGKTRIFAEHVALQPATLRIEVYVPTHALALEWKESIKTYNPNGAVSIIAGRSYDTVDRGPLCRRHKLAAEISREGQSVYTRLCKSNSGEICHLYHGCDYIDQYSGANILIYTHAHLCLDRGMLDARVPDMVVIDESFFLTCLDTIELNGSLLTHPAIPVSAQMLCADMAGGLAAGSSLTACMAKARRHGGGLKSALRDLRDVAPKPTPDQSDTDVRHAIKSGPNLEPVARLLEHISQALEHKAILQSVDYDLATGIITAHHRKDITRFKPESGKPEPTIYILDASASETVIAPLIPISEFVRHRAPRNAHVVQCRTSRCSTSSLTPNKHADPQRAADATRRLFEVQRLIDAKSTNDHKLLVVGPSSITGNPNQGVPALLQVPAHCALAHYNAIRGVDAWRGFDTILVIGRNEPPTRAVEDLARALFYDNPTPLNLTGTWITEERGYRLASGREGVDVAVHPDHRVQAVLEQIRESETLQAIDRLRLIHNVEKKTVLLLCNIPLDLDVDELLTWDEFMQGSRLERAWDQLNGVLPLNPAWLTGRFPDLWHSGAAAKQDVLAERKKDVLSNSISIGKLILFEYEYKAAGQRRWSHGLSTWDDLEAVKTELDALIALPVTVRAQAALSYPPR
jgi:hypothetical protein